MTSTARPPSIASLHVQTDDENAVERTVRAFLPRIGRSESTEVTPAHNGWVAVVDELSLAANPTLVARLTGADPARIRAVVRVASSPAELPPARQLLGEIAAVMKLEARIER